MLSSMAKLKVTAFAASLNPPVTRQRINDLCNRGDLLREGMYIDTEHPKNASWLEARKGCPAPPKPPGRWGGVAQPTKPQEEPVFTDESASDALTRLLTASNIQNMNLADVQKVRTIESALKTRVEREHKRRDLIERVLVRTVFGRLYQIDTQELRTIGSKLAAEIAGKLGVDDPAVILDVEQRIDGEILKSLAHIKRVLNDFLASIGSDVL